MKRRKSINNLIVMLKKNITVTSTSGHGKNISMVGGKRRNNIFV